MLFMASVAQTLARRRSISPIAGSRSHCRTCEKSFCAVHNIWNSCAESALTAFVSITCVGSMGVLVAIVYVVSSLLAPSFLAQMYVLFLAEMTFHVESPVRSHRGGSSCSNLHPA